MVRRRGGVGGRTGRRKPWGISPGANVVSKERLCSTLYLSTRDRTSLLLKESIQSLGSLIPPPGISNAGARTLLRAYTYCRPMPRSLERSQGERVLVFEIHAPVFQIHLCSGLASSKLDLNVSPEK